MLLLPLRRVIVADADPIRQLYVAETLKLLGAAQVETFADAEAAARRAASEPCDLVMAAWDGAGALPADFRAHGALVVAMGPSSLRGREGQAAARCGADLALAGPFLRSGLFAALDALIAGQAGRRLKVVDLRAQTAAPAPASAVSSALSPAAARPASLMRVTLSRGRARAS
ncbi:MAG: hypothetical protein ACO27F_04390 [Beijerinckiaceae bacterium]